MFLKKENLTTEFKREYIDDIRLTVLAFANTAGGTLYVGIEDDGSICGVKCPDETVLKIQNVLRDSIKPDIMMCVKCSYLDLSGKSVIKVEVHRGTHRPYFLGSKGIRPEGVYIRQSASTVPASFDAIRRMIVETSGDEFERGVSFEQSLSFDACTSTFKALQIPFGAPQMQSLGMINQEKLYTNLAFILSDQCQHTLKVAVFQGNNKLIFRDRAEFSGSILKQLDEAFAFIMRYNSVRSTYSGLRRVDTWAYPETAIREGLLNAIVHRSYESSGPILVNIYDNRIDILNQGGLLPNMTVEEVRQGVSEQRNKQLAAIFYRLELIEAFGTGYDKIDEAYAESGKKADIKVTANSFLLLLPNTNYVVESSGMEKQPIATDTNVNLSSLGGDLIQKRSRILIEQCRQNNSITRAEIQSMFELSSSSVIALLSKLTKEGIFVKEGSGKNTKYVLKKIS